MEYTKPYHTTCNVYIAGLDILGFQLRSVHLVTIDTRADNSSRSTFEHVRNLDMYVTSYSNVQCPYSDSTFMASGIFLLYNKTIKKNIPRFNTDFRCFIEPLTCTCMKNRVIY